MLKQLASDTVAYGISSVISRFIGFLLIPVFTRTFSPKDYGVISLVTTLFTLFSILTVLGLDNSIARWYYDDTDENSRKASLNTFLWSCVSIGCVIAGSTILLRGVIAEDVLGENLAGSVLIFAGLNLPLTAFTTFTTNVLRIQRRPIATSLVTIVISVLTVGASVLFVVVLEVGFVGVFYAQLVTSTVLAIITCWLFRKIIDPFTFSLSRWKEMFRFSAPLIPGSVAFWIVNLSGVYFIQAYKDSFEVGLYQVGLSIASSMLLLTGAFQMAWGPFAYSIYKEPGAKEVFATTLELYTGGSTLAAVALTLFAHEILSVFTTAQYAEADWIVGILAFNYVLTGLGYVANVGPSIVKSNRVYGIANIASATVLVILNILLVPAFGMEGAAVAIVSSQILIPVVVFAHSQSVYPINYNFPKTAFLLAVGAIVGFGTLFLLNEVPLHDHLRAGCKVIVLFSYTAVLILSLKPVRKLFQRAAY